MDSDDWLAKDALESIYEYQQQMIVKYVLLSNYNYDDKTKNITSITSGINNELLPNKRCLITMIVKKYISVINYYVLDKMLSKRFYTKIYENWFWNKWYWRCSCYYVFNYFCKKITHLSKPLYYYRQNRTNSLESAKDMYPLNFYNGYKRFYELVKQLPFFEDIKISYMNRALSGCRYALLSKKTGEGYYKTYKFLKETGFKELGVLGYSENCYYNKNDYNLLKYIVDFEYILIEKIYFY